jgi:hypothetical protein
MICSRFEISYQQALFTGPELRQVLRWSGPAAAAVAATL